MLMKYRWISWVQHSEDFRPENYPPGEKVLGWWCTGDGQGLSLRTGEYQYPGKTLCALVDASTDADAKAAILQDWPDAGEWRFCDGRSNTYLGDRFPLQPWMQERMSRQRGHTGDVK